MRKLKFLWPGPIGPFSHAPLLPHRCLFEHYSCTFQSKKSLSLGEGASYKEIDDIAIDGLPDDTVVDTGAKVTAATLTKYSACLACNCKLEATKFSDNIAQCKCGMQQLLEKIIILLFSTVGIWYPTGNSRGKQGHHYSSSAYCCWYIRPHPRPIQHPQ